VTQDWMLLAGGLAATAALIVGRRESPSGFGPHENAESASDDVDGSPLRRGTMLGLSWREMRRWVRL
jgi:hypothetical protein